MNSTLYFYQHSPRVEFSYQFGHDYMPNIGDIVHITNPFYFHDTNRNGIVRNHKIGRYVHHQMNKNSRKNKMAWEFQITGREYRHSSRGMSESIDLRYELLD